MKINVGWAVCATLFMFNQAAVKAAVAVDVVAVETRPIVASANATGQVFSRNDVRITAGINGRIKRVLEVGSIVKPSDLLLEIDDSDLLLNIKEQQAIIKRSQTELDFLLKELSRQEKLAEKNGISISQLQQLERDKQNAQSDLDIALIRLEQFNLEKTRSKNFAPFAGMVTERNFNVGEDISQGSAILRLTDLDQLEVRSQIPINYSRALTPGDTLTLYGYDSIKQGQLRSIVPNLNNRAQSMELRIDLPLSGMASWSIGQLVSVSIPLGEQLPKLSVPRDALVIRQEGTFIFTINADFIAKRIEINVGDSSGDWVAVISREVTTGDCVVIRGAETLKTGDQVTIISGSRVCG